MKFTCKHCSEEIDVENTRIDTYYDFDFDINTDNPNYWKNFEMTNAIMNTYRGLFERIGFKVNSVKNLEISKGIFCPKCEYFYTSNELVKILFDRFIFLLDELIPKEETEQMVNLNQNIENAIINYIKDKENEIA